MGAAMARIMVELETELCGSLVRELNRISKAQQLKDRILL